MKPALPDLPTITLMQPTLVAQPVHRDGWVYEEKYDGWRMVAYKAGDTVQLVSRPGRDHAKRFPALVAAIRGLAPATLILDGEVCLFDHQLVSRFEWLRHGKPPGVATPPLFMAFDCVNGHPNFPTCGHRKFPTPGFTPWPRRGGRGRP